MSDTMRMTEIVEHPAQQLTLMTDETFLQFADRVQRTNTRPIMHKDGHLLELDPESEYSFLMLGLTRLATPEEFAVLLKIIMQAVDQAEAQGVIPKKWVRSVATPFDIPKRPELSERFADELEEGARIKCYLTGNTTFTFVKEPPPPLWENTVPMLSTEDTTIRVSWEPHRDATEYSVQYVEGDSFVGGELIDDSEWKSALGTAETEAELTGLQPDTQYSVRVVAVTPSGKVVSGANAVMTESAVETIRS